MNVAIIGYGVEGASSCEYYMSRGDSVTICDQNADIASKVPKGVVTKTGPTYLDGIKRFDLVVRSAGIHPRILIDQYPDISDDSITSNINEYLLKSPTKNIIGVTGTKGKGTTSTLIALMLEAAGKRVFLGGNIGYAPLSFISEVAKDDWVVLELSSFQLQDCKYSPHIAVCLMIVPEHLNWHSDYEEYVNAKANLFANQQPTDIAIYFADNTVSHQIASTSPGDKIAYYAEPGAFVENGNIVIDGQIICGVDELQLLGEHNWQNVCAAVTAAWQAGIMDISALKSVLTAFPGLPHRLELLGEKNNVTYYNDSFAATPDAAIAALQAIEGPKVMIMGGFDRQLPIGHLAAALQASHTDLRKVILIGESAGRLAGECDKIGFHNYHVSLEVGMSDIVANAAELAKPGDTIVLSPGFASFDMFKNFEDRGNQFRSAFEAL